MPATRKPKILAFDTSTPRGSVALLEGTELQAELKLQRLQNHSANLLRSVDFLLDSLGWNLEDLDLVASGIGPGSFTGIRIGIATGLGIAQSLSLPFAGISGLEALGNQVLHLQGRVGVLLDAHRSQAYYAEYLISGRKMREGLQPTLVYLEDLPVLLKTTPLFLIGDTSLYPGELIQIPKSSWPRIIETDPYLSASIGRRALSVKRRWKSGTFLQCEPLYIRPPDAVKNKEGKR
ncbi:MAG: tRNA (adenosine(37)-N6)-threonylcarbamoyltransferase complex dimerization subunit type 1 TsaB [Acidobacteriota bacterium]|jgi:tRNA threonylcarbamoyladenosine biosynthesis protein TsaB